MLNPLSGVPLPSHKRLFQVAVFSIVVLSLSLGYYATSYQAMVQKFDKKDHDFKRLQRYIGTDKSLEILKKE